MNYIRSNTLSIGMVAADIRLALASQPDTQQAKVSHKAFLVKRGKEAREDQETQRKPRQKEQKGKKRSRQGSSKDKAGRYKAYRLRHTLSNCFYTFPKKAYTGFKPVQALANQAQRRIEENKKGLTVANRYPLNKSILLDSGATIHIFKDTKQIKNLRAAALKDFFWSGVIQVLIEGYGKAQIKLELSNSTPRIL
ncbi:hypothetical protein CEK25_006868 [Fusarium fujikuroi]|nr:hypothetical protein CEK25_006868 [Fusarium fujikuroi]